MTKETEVKLMEYVERIRRYKTGLIFTFNCSQMTDGQYNAINWVVNKAEQLGLIKCTSIGHSFEDLCGKSGRFYTEITFVKL